MLFSRVFVSFPLASVILKGIFTVRLIFSIGKSPTFLMDSITWVSSGVTFIVLFQSRSPNLFRWIYTPLLTASWCCVAFSDLSGCWSVSSVVSLHVSVSILSSSQEFRSVHPLDLDPFVHLDHSSHSH